MSGLRIQTIPKIRKLIESDKRYRVAYGGRGSGKSYGVASYLVVKGLTESTRILCAKETQNTLADSALALMKRVIHDHGLDDCFQTTKTGLFCTQTGTEYIFRGLQHPERIQSLEGVKYCWVEEATKVSQSAWNILAPTIREAGSEIWVTFNPDQEDDPTYDRFVVVDRPDAEVVKINYPDNRFLPEPLRQEMAYDKATDYDKYLWVWEGHPRTVTDAQVFKGKFRVAAFDTPPDVDRFYYGADWGFSQDPSTLVRCFIRNQILWVDYEAYGVGVDIDDLPDLFRAVPGADKWPITGDSQRPDTMSFLRKHGFTVWGAKKGQGSVEDGIAFIRSFRGIVVHERCKHTADEMKLYSYKTDKLTGDVLPVLEDKHNHCIDALRYALEKLMRAIGSVGNMRPAV
jgi:phage terminase large subunit